MIKVARLQLPTAVDSSRLL